MSARALIRSRHFRGRAQAERLHSIETIREKWWQFKNSRHMFSFRRDKAVTKQIRVLTLKAVPRETLLPHIFFSKLIVFATIVNLSFEVKGSQVKYELCQISLYFCRSSASFRLF